MPSTKTQTTATQARPFLKWVGGKGRLLSQLQEYYPKKYKRYFEPFLGGGAVFFDVQPSVAFLNDINTTLITAYRHIQKKPAELIKLLGELEKKYHKKSETDRSNYYYEIRARFNELKDGTIEKTVCLIFLNKTGFNGLYRESSTGGFNVPFGRYKNPKILDADNILSVSKSLRDVELLSGSFEEAVKDARRGDFVYFDPPYFPLTKTSTFTSYHEKKFLKDEQIKLRDVYADLDKRGCFVMLSNSYTDLISQLYKQFNQNTVLASRAINCKAEGRGKINEYIITNY